MKVKLTARGRKLVETFEIPKKVREQFYSLFRKTSEIDCVFLRWGDFRLNVSDYDEGMCKAIMLLSRPHAYIETVQKGEVQNTPKPEEI